MKDSAGPGSAPCDDSAPGIAIRRTPSPPRRRPQRSEAPRADVRAGPDENAECGKAETLIRGTTWRDPAAVATWVRDVPREKEIVVHCVFGHEVGRATALRLRAQGVNARFLRGGIDGWQAAGRPLDPEGTAS